MSEKKFFPFDPAKAHTVTNPDGFPVYWNDGKKAEVVCIFPSGTVCVEWGDGVVCTYAAEHIAEYLRLGPKPGKTVYLNAWADSEGLLLWDEFTTEDGAKMVALSNPQLEYHHIAIPVPGPEIEP